MSSHDADPQDEDDMLAAEDAAEEIEEDGDHPMDGGEGHDDDEATIELVNNSIAYFDQHTDSIYAIAAHPRDPFTVATGAGDDSARVFSTAGIEAPEPPVLPGSYMTQPPEQQPRESIETLAHLTGFSDSVSSLTYTRPDGAYLVCAGLDGQVRVFDSAKGYAAVAEAQEVEGIEWLIPCPHALTPNCFALGASDGSVWVYSISESQTLDIVQTYYQHNGACTAGAFSPSGSLLASVSEDGSLCVYDPFGDAAAAGVQPATGGQALVSLTSADQRFVVEGGLYSVAFAPSGAFLAAGGAEGHIRIVGVPLLSQAPQSATKSQKGAGAGAKKAGKQAGSGQSGQILASLQAQTDGIETLSFAAAPLTLLAAGSVDGSIALFDHAHGYAVRRLMRGAHDDQAVVKVAFAPASAGAGDAAAQGARGWMLTSCGMDGVVRRWDTRGGTAAAGSGLVNELRGHRGDGEGGGVMGFVEHNGRIVTAGDDGVALVFEAGEN